MLFIECPSRTFELILQFNFIFSKNSIYIPPNQLFGPPPIHTQTHKPYQHWEAYVTIIICRIFSGWVICLKLIINKHQISAIEL